MPIDKKDWTLLVIAAASGKPLTPAQLQKCLFLLGQEMRREVGRAFYDFSPYHFGPFDQTIYFDAEKLAQDGLVSLTQVAGRNWFQYAATTAGLTKAQALAKKLPDTVRDYLEEVVKWALSLSFQQLIRSIYQKYPEFRKNSVFQE